MRNDAIFNLLVGALTITVISVLQACAQMQTIAPQSASEKIAAAQATTTQIRSTALMLLESKKISADDAQNVQDQADTATKAIQLVRRSLVVDPVTKRATFLGTDEAKLQATMVILNALVGYLQTKQAAEPLTAGVH